MIARSLYDNLPQHLIDADTEGYLAHIVAAIQPDLDTIYSRIETEPDLYDVDFTPAQFQDWLGQLVGLERVGSKYLGLGLNPNWSFDRKREAIDNAWVYWQILGTPLGIATAMRLWLGWLDAQDPEKLEPFYPFGDRSTQHLPGWWNWATAYFHNHLRTYPHQKKWGVGANPGRPYQPLDILTNSSWQGGDRLLGSGSGLAPDSLWMHLRPSLGDWNSIFPDVVDLAPEILNAAIEPQIIGWLDFTGSLDNSIAAIASPPVSACELEEDLFAPAQVLPSVSIPGFTPAQVSAIVPQLDGSTSSIIYDLCQPLGTSEFDLYPQLALAGRADNWTVELTTADGSYIVRPVTIFTYQTDYRFFENRNVIWSDTFDRFYLEFIFKARTKCQHISQLDFRLGGDLVRSIVPTTPLKIDDRHEVGIKFDCKFTLRPWISIFTPNSPIEGDVGSAIVVRGGNLATDLTVNYVVSGSATPDSDYTSFAASITIPAGNTQHVIEIETLADALSEGTETIEIALAPVSGYTMLANLATIYIVDGGGYGYGYGGL